MRNTLRNVLLGLAVLSLVASIGCKKKSKKGASEPAAAADKKVGDKAADKAPEGAVADKAPEGDKVADEKPTEEAVPPADKKEDKTAEPPAGGGEMQANCVKATENIINIMTAEMKTRGAPATAIEGMKKDKAKIVSQCVAQTQKHPQGAAMLACMTQAKSTQDMMGCSQKFPPPNQGPPQIEPTAAPGGGAPSAGKVEAGVPAVVPAAAGAAPTAIRVEGAKSAAEAVKAAQDALKKAAAKVPAAPTPAAPAAAPAAPAAK